MFSISRSAVCALAAALICTAGANASTFRDSFRDGSHRLGPVLVRVPAAQFVMGASPQDELYRTSSVLHRVVLSPFAMAQFDVTNAQFADFLNDLHARHDEEADLVQIGSAPGLVFAPGGYPVSAPNATAALPATGVTWQGALAYTRWLSRKTGQQYTLPTEAQWEYAARAGGADVNCGGAHAAPLPASQLRPNRLGISGMPGNVWDWTADCLDINFYFHSPLRDPRYVDANCPAPIIRGGSFRDAQAYCSPGFRVNYFARGSGDIGFRVVRRIEGARIAAPSMSEVRSAPLLIAGETGGALEIRVNGPRTDLPLALMMGVSVPVPESQLNGVSPLIADFLSQRREVPLALGSPTRITGLPAMPLKLYFVAADVSVQAHRTVSIPAQGTAQVNLSVRELIGNREYGELRGVLRASPNGLPVSGATIVYGSYPDRSEAQTDGRGRFMVRADANRNGQLLVDARGRGGRTVLVPVTAATVNSGTPLNLDLQTLLKAEHA